MARRAVRIKRNYAGTNELRNKSTEQLQELLANNGNLIRNIATAFRVAPTTVSRIFKSKGMTVRGRGNTSENGKMAIRIGEMRVEVDSNIRLSALREKLKGVRFITVEL